ncbi:hypothetical protein ACIP39_10495 [Streptomyces tibetensis]|uniref:hypothetical protein n=1 Tax=Streptomyces tibetensis TaxID=2382123 RepID=UPI003807002C
MRKQLRNRLAALLTASALFTGSGVVLGASNAAAASWTFEKSAVSSNGSYTIAAYNDGAYAGVMSWNADAFGDIPGDAFRAVDALGDGYAMEATMIHPVGGRTATTRGHAAPYYSPWASGNLAEGTTVYIQLCAVKGEYSSCSIAYSGHA